ncbi:hypothetical protein B0I35DRAFT_412300 [Stachybotrys elegans]|uniref:Uncharacterized protein n=1 Tax=Stachybotrys elegans TaxID=80388 RepID=A0A8K0SKP8_9HYPO|nr:hypothetical protein B0I35DRAFT_412300 [Stachybotrys elegans]
MKSLAVTGLLCGLVAYVEASIAANPWQHSMFYSAYRMHVEVYGVGNHPAYAPCVSTTSPKGICSFDEFAEYVRTKPNGGGTPWPRNVVDALNVDTPDPKAAVAAIRHAVDEKVAIMPSNTASAQIDKLKLFPVNPITANNFTPQLQRLNDLIQDLRKEAVAKWGVDLSEAQRTSGHWKNFETSMFRKDIAYIETTMGTRKNGVKFVRKTVTSSLEPDPQYNKWDEPDYDKMRANGEDMNKVTSIMNAYNSDKKKGMPHHV